MQEIITLGTIQRSTGVNAKASEDIQPMSASFSDLAHLHCGNCMKIAGDQPRRGWSPAIRSVTGLVNWRLLGVSRGRSRTGRLCVNHASVEGAFRRFA